MEAPLGRRLFAEGVGTGILVLFGAGSVVAALTMGDGQLDYAGLGMIAITFGLVIAVAIGFAVATAILLIGPLTGGSLNPARTFGPLLVNTFGGGDTAWGDLPAYLIGPIVGGVAAVVSYDAIARPRMYEEPEPAQGTAGEIEGRATGRFARGETTTEGVTHG